MLAHVVRGLGDRQRGLEALGKGLLLLRRAKDHSNNCGVAKGDML
jgi:hypothetical protein